MECAMKVRESAPFVCRGRSRPHLLSGCAVHLPTSKARLPRLWQRSSVARGRLITPVEYASAHVGHTGLVILVFATACVSAISCLRLSMLDSRLRRVAESTAGFLPASLRAAASRAALFLSRYTLTRAEALLTTIVDAVWGNR